MNKESLIAEINRLLDAGEPLLTLFPRQLPDDWLLQLPDNISDAMRWHAQDMSLRAWAGEGNGVSRQGEPTDFLAAWVKDLEAGLLGWRAIGVLK